MNTEPKSFSLRKRRLAVRSCACEPLECRVLLSTVVDASHPIERIGDFGTTLSREDNSRQEFPGGVTVTDTQIFTKTETIPRFVAEPTITNIRGGQWDDPGTWSLGRVPSDGDRVAIAADTIVRYEQQSDARIDGIEINGALVFSRAVDTRLVVADLTVMPTGKLLIGNSDAPVAAGVKAELVFADEAIDTDLDPEQFGTGLIALGTVTIHGSEIDSTWTRLVYEPKAGDVSLLFQDSVDTWRAGDHVVLPDTRQVLSTEQDEFRADEIPPQREEVVIARVEGHRVFLEAPLQYDHLGARNASGELELLPHAALLNRNVIIRSENPAGTRGHTMFTARANTDIAYARFLDMGRTDALRPLNSTRFDPFGNVLLVGTNQIARYAVHFHHLMGPENPDNKGYQFKFVGNTVERSLKWAVDVHGSSFGLVSRNVVYDAQGAGIVTEGGSEIGNLFERNFVVRIQGTHVDGKAGILAGDYGRGGSGFWFRRGGNLIVGNVAADNTYAGFVIDGSHSGTVVLPLFRGAERDQPGQGVKTELSPLTLLANNEAYGMTPVGVWAVFTSGSNRPENQPLTYFKNLSLWNVSRTGVVAYHTANVTFDNLLILGDLAAQDRNNSGTRGMDLRTYENRDLVIRQSRIEGLRRGILAPVNDSKEAGFERPTVIQNTILKNYINIVASPSRDDRPSHGNVLEVRNVKFELLTELPDGPVAPDLVPPPANIYMRGTGENINLTYPSIVRVYDYNQVPGDDFQVFYHEQASSFLMPRTDPTLIFSREGGTIGSPEGGLTNAENWETHGVAFAGALAPAEATASRAEINGLVGPIQDLSAQPPRVVFVTPWDGAQAIGTYVRIRHNVVGQLPPGAQVYMQLDDDIGNRFSEFKDGGLFGLSSGLHTLRGYIADENGIRLPGTSTQVVSFFVIA